MAAAPVAAQAAAARARSAAWCCRRAAPSMTLHSHAASLQHACRCGDERQDCCSKGPLPPALLTHLPRAAPPLVLQARDRRHRSGWRVCSRLLAAAALLLALLPASVRAG
jgi:hypothetical protein